MARGKDDFKYKVSEECDEVFDEQGSMVLALRKISWGDSEPKLDLRKWFIGINGEVPSKGFTFLTEEGPHNLTKVLLKQGFGDTREVLETIKDRPDFENALEKAMGFKELTEDNIKTDSNNEDDDTEYYDPKEFLI